MKTWHHMDKSKWKDGPWNNEPDKAQWVYNGLDCLIVRNHYGALCGYVGVPESSQYFEKHYDQVHEAIDLDVHGGLTFANKCRPHPEGDHKGICHIEEGAANKTVWWLGFDCAHAWDYSPRDSERENENPIFRQNPEDIYRNFSYVKTEVEYLARQLLENNEKVD